MPHGAPAEPGLSGASVSVEQDQASLGWWPFPWLSWPHCGPPERPQSPPTGGWSPGSSPGARRGREPRLGEACLFLGIHGMSACHKYLDREDLWMRFAILFSLRVINQPHAHSGCRPEACTHSRSDAHTKCSPRPPHVPQGGRRSSPGLFLSSRKGKTWVPNCCLVLGDPRTIWNQGLKSGRQDVPVIRETAHYTGYKYKLRCLNDWVRTLGLQVTSCVSLAMLLTEFCASVFPSVKWS